MQRERFEHLLMYDRVTITIELKDLKLLLLFTTKINFWVLDRITLESIMKQYRRVKASSMKFLLVCTQKVPNRVLWSHDPN